MDLDRIQGGIDKAQEHLDKLRKPGGEKQPQATNEGENGPAEQRAAGQAWHGDERREKQTDYDGEDRRKQEYSYGDDEKPVGDEASGKPTMSDPDAQPT